MYIFIYYTKGSYKMTLQFPPIPFFSNFFESFYIRPFTHRTTSQRCRNNIG